MATSPKDVFDHAPLFEDESEGGWCSDQTRPQPYRGRSWLDPGPVKGAAPCQPEEDDLD